MVSENRIEAEIDSPDMQGNALGRILYWNGSWYKWRAAMEAMADLQGVGDAVEAGVAMVLSGRERS